MRYSTNAHDASGLAASADNSVANGEGKGALRHPARGQLGERQRRDREIGCHRGCDPVAFDGHRRLALAVGLTGPAGVDGGRLHRQTVGVHAGDELERLPSLGRVEGHLGDRPRWSSPRRSGRGTHPNVGYSRPAQTTWVTMAACRSSVVSASAAGAQLVPRRGHGYAGRLQGRRVVHQRQGGEVLGRAIEGAVVGERLAQRRVNVVRVADRVPPGDGASAPASTRSGRRKLST